MDYSFLKLYNSLSSALSDDPFKDRQITYYTSIQLSPTESYLQMTNYSGGISFGGNYEVYLVDECDNELADITDHIFIEEFTDANGDTQCKIEFVYLNEDFYGRAVFFKFSHPISGQSYYTKPVKITDKDIKKTYRFDYTNSGNLLGLSYENADCSQSIRLRIKYTSPLNDTQVGEYYQLSSQKTISTRILPKLGEKYLMENLDEYTFQRVQKLFEHNSIYMDNKRVTTNPVINPGERKGQSNLMSGEFDVYKNNDDIFTFEFQVFDGFTYTSLYPIDGGNYTLGGIDADLTMTFSTNITLGIGTLTIYDASDNSVVSTYTQNDMTVSTNTLTIAGILGTGNDIGANGDYYVLVNSGLVDSVLGLEFEGISDPTEWNFTIKDGDYDSADYNSSDYLTN